MDGLNYEIIDELNGEKNLRENALIRLELQRRLDADAQLKELFERSFFPGLNEIEYADCIFPYKGAWYAVNNGSVREHNDFAVYGPFSTEQLICFVRQSKFLEKEDPVLFRDVSEYFAFPLFGKTLPPRHEETAPKAAAVPEVQVPEKEWDEESFHDPCTLENLLKNIFLMSPEDFDRLAEDFFAGEERIKKVSSGDPAADKREALRRLVRLMDTVEPPSWSTYCRQSSWPIPRPQLVSWGNTPVLELLQWREEQSGGCDGGAGGTEEYDYLTRLDKLREEDWKQAVRRYGLYTGPIQRYLRSFPQVDCFCVLSTESGCCSEYANRGFDNGVRSIYLHEPFGLYGTYRLYWLQRAAP